MSDKSEEPKKQEILKTFDMYHFFSRKDVILMILFILLMLGIIIFKAFFDADVV